MIAYGTTDGVARDAAPAFESQRSKHARLAAERQAAREAAEGEAEAHYAAQAVLNDLHRPEVWRAIAEHAATVVPRHTPGTRSHDVLRRLTVVAADLADLLDCSGEQPPTREEPRAS